MTTSKNDQFEGSRIGKREASRLRRKVYIEMIRRDWRKYLAWVVALVLGTKFFLLNRQAVQIMLSIYAVARKIDDVVDLDAPLPQGYKTTVEYVERLLRASSWHANSIRASSTCTSSIFAWVCGYRTTCGTCCGTSKWVSATSPLKTCGHSASRCRPTARRNRWRGGVSRHKCDRGLSKKPTTR